MTSKKRLTENTKRKHFVDILAARNATAEKNHHHQRHSKLIPLQPAVTNIGVNVNHTCTVQYLKHTSLTAYVPLDSTN